MKRFSIFIWLCTIFLLVGTKSVFAQTGNWTDNVSLNFVGAGTPDDPYQINSAQDLALLAKNVNSGNTYGEKYFIQNNNINLSAHYWIPIGNGPQSFCGSYDGNGNVISNMTIEIALTSTSQGFGLFGSIAGTNKSTYVATIKNLIIQGGSICLTNAQKKEFRVGTFVGAMAKNTMLTNCSAIDCSILVEGMDESNLNRHTGGLVGDIAIAFGKYEVITSGFEPIIDNCYSNVDITIPTTYTVVNAYQTEASGIVGRLRHSAVLPTHCYYTGLINAPNAIIAPIYGTMRYNAGSTQNAIPDFYTQKDVCTNTSPRVPQMTADDAKDYFGNYSINGTAIEPDLSNLVLNENAPTMGYSYYSVQAYINNNITMPMVQGVNFGRYLSVNSMRSIFNNVSTEKGYLTWGNVSGHLAPIKLQLELNDGMATIANGESDAYIVWTVNDREITDNHTLSYTLTEEENNYLNGIIIAHIYNSSTSTEPPLILTRHYNVIPNGSDIVDTETRIDNNTDEPTWVKILMPEGSEGVGSFLYYKWYINGIQISEGTGLQTFIFNTDNLKALKSTLSVQIFSDADNDIPLKEMWDILTFNNKNYLTLKENPYNETPSVNADYIRESPSIFTHAGTSSFPYTTRYEWKVNDEVKTHASSSSIELNETGQYELTITLTPKTGQPDYLIPVEYQALYSRGLVVYCDPVGTYGGNDINNGTTPNTPVKTLAQAYRVLKDLLQVNTNFTVDPDHCIIVLMSNVYITDNDNRNKALYSDKSGIITNLENNVPATITGNFNGIPENKPTMFLRSGNQCGIYLLADTKFEHLIFESSDGECNSFYAQGYDLTFGYGLEMRNFAQSNGAGNTCHEYFPSGSNKTYSTALEVALGFNIPTMPYGSKVDGVYIPSAVNPYHGFEGFSDNDDKVCTFTMHSGSIGRILGCGRNDAYTSKQANGRSFASANFPFNVEVIIDIPEDEQNNRAAITNRNDDNLRYDVNFLIMGQADGSCFTNAKLTVKSGSIGRIVGGNLGYFDDYGKTNEPDIQYSIPKNTYFGRTEITIDEVDGLTHVDDIFGGTLGRSGGGEAYPCYYGQIDINILNGSIGSLFAVGAGGITGYYENSSDPFRDWGKLFMEQYANEYFGIEGTESKININMTGGTIENEMFGGGYGKSALCEDAYHVFDAGALYGNTIMNITGGVIRGNLYGAGSGASDLLNKNNRYGYSLNNIAQMRGNTVVNIGGNAVIEGDVYGGGKGVNGAPGMARLFGDSEVHIGGTATINGSVYGGGALSSITGNTALYIGEGKTKPIIADNIYGGGKGSTKQEAQIISSDGTSVSKVYIMGGKFQYQSDNLFDVHNCIFGGGNINCHVEKSDIRIYESLIPDNVTDNEYDYFNENFDIVRFHILGGGLGIKTTTDTTNIFLDLLSKERGYINMYGGGFEGTTTTTNITIGSTEDPQRKYNDLNIVFGGSFMSNVGSGTIQSDGTYTDLTGSTNVTIYNINANRIYGGGYIGNIYGNTNVLIQGGTINYIFGGGEAASVLGNSNVSLDRMIQDKNAPDTYMLNPIPLEYTQAVFGGGHGDDEHAANVNGTSSVIIKGSYYTLDQMVYQKFDNDRPLYSIYGGCYYNGTVGNTQLLIRIPDRDEAASVVDIYGTTTEDRTSAIYPDLWDIISEHSNVSQIASIYGAGYGEMTQVANDTYINVQQLGLHNYINIFGGGMNGIVKGNTHIIFGENGIRYNDESRKYKNTANTIYGGGLNAAVEGSTTITLYSGYINNIFAGGENGDVLGNTTIETFRPTDDTDTPKNKNSEITKGTLDLTINGNLYGGGKRANVIGESSIFLTGNITIPRNIQNDGTSTSGNIFGGGLGFVDSNDGSIISSADVTSTNIQISGPDTDDADWSVNIQGDIYGGGNVASHVKESVVLISGKIGDEYSDIQSFDDINSPNYIQDIEIRKATWESILLNIYGGGKGHQTSVNKTYVSIGDYGQTVTTLVGNVFGGGEGGDIGNKITDINDNIPLGYPYKDFTKGGDNSNNTTQQNLGFTEVRVLHGAKVALNAYGGCNKSNVFGNTKIIMLGGIIGTNETTLADYGNFFGGSNTGFVYGNTECIVGECYYILDDANKSEFISKEQYEALNDKTGYQECKFSNTILNGTINCTDIKIMNALFGGGNISFASPNTDSKVYANTETVIGNSYIYITDDPIKDYIEISSDGTGGLYGDGNLVLTKGYRYASLDGYGSQYHTLRPDITINEFNKLNDREQAYYNLMYHKKNTDESNTNYITEDEYNKLSNGEREEYEMTNKCVLKAGRMLNTLQRADKVILRNSRLVMLGAPDKVPQVVDYTNYSVNRVDTIECISDHKNSTSNNKGNYFGIYNITNLLGSLLSDVEMTDTRYDTDGNLAADGISYYDYKKPRAKKNDRNQGTSPNEVAIANGAWLTIEHLVPGTDDGSKEYGEVRGVFQLSLLSSSSGEGGGYVYAKNMHGVDANGDNAQNDIIQSTGNFVHPEINVIDECFLESGNLEAPGHYWYLKGDIYVYNLKLSAFTGTSQAYNLSTILPLVQLDAATAGKIKLTDIKDNYYCINPGEYDKKKYGYNDIISSYDYKKLAPADQLNFVPMTYVKKNADHNNLQQNDIISGSVYEGLSDEEKGNYFISNCVSRYSGFTFNLNLSNPKNYLCSANTDDNNQSIKPKFIFEGDDITVLGQRSFNVGTFETDAINNIQAATLGHFYGQDGAQLDVMLNRYPEKESCNSLAVFEKGYIAKKPISSNYYDLDGNLITFMQTGSGIGQKQYDYNATKGDDLNEQFEAAYLCLKSVVINNVLYGTGEVIGATEYNNMSDEDKTNFCEAYICTRQGNWGGYLFEPGKSYDITYYSDLTQEERDANRFTYDNRVLDLLDPINKYDFDYENNYEDYDYCYDKECQINVKAICKENFTSINGTSYTKDQEISEEEFNLLCNEKSNFYSCYINDVQNECYVCMEPKLNENDQTHSIGSVIDRSKYDELSDSEKSRYTHIDRNTLTQGGVYYFTLNEGGYTSNAGFTFNKKQLYFNTNENFVALIDEKNNFTVKGDSPEASFILYVAREATLNTLRYNRIVTVEFTYMYNEYDNEAGGYTPIEEHYIINLELEFKSGAPEIGLVSELPKVIPGSSITLKQPRVTQGAYVIEGTGWEISTTPDFLSCTEYNAGMPVYWYEDGYYIRFYAITYLGKTTSAPTRVNVANYHRMNEVLSNSNNMYVTKGAHIYIDGVQELLDFNTFFSLSANSDTFYNKKDDLGNTFNPHLCEGLQFYMQSDVDMTNETWTPIGSPEACFMGTFHGNGACISNLNITSTDSHKGFFGKTCGNVYNLGIQGNIQGSDYVGGIAGETSDSTIIENCWFYGNINATGSNKGAIVGGTEGGNTYFHNCYYNIGNSEEYSDDIIKGYRNTTTDGITYKGKEKFLNGEVAYFLNSYYLNRRLDNIIGEDVNKHNDKYSYIEAFFTENDNNICEPWDWTFIRTYHEPGQYANGINYYDQTRIRDNNHAPFYDPTNKDAYNEYILFGQDINPKGGNAWPVICNIRYTLCRNRVLRAICYRGDSTPHGFYHSANAHVWEGDITSVDLTGNYDFDKQYYDMATQEYLEPLYTDNTKDMYYPPLLDETTLESYTVHKDWGITSNLLTYATSKDRNYNNLSSIDILSQEPYAYKISTPETNIYGHAIGYNMPAGTKGGEYVAELLHVVDDESFNAPIAFTAKKAWYDRKPSNYVNNGNDAWETIALPFTAQHVEAYVPNDNMTHIKAPADAKHGFSYTSMLNIDSYGNGSITHFYGDDNTDKDNCGDDKTAGNDNANNVGHQYWLRTASSIGTESINGTEKSVIYFSRPMKSDALYSKYVIGEYEYSPTCEWYWKGNTEEQSYNYEEYPFLTANLPYIISFPGMRYYEFDLSGRYQSGTKVQTVGRQAIEYSAVNANIGITDIEIQKATQTIGSYNLIPTFAKRAISDKEMLINDEGTAFEHKETTPTTYVHPFHVILAKNSRNNSGRLFIANEYNARNIFSLDRDDDEQQKEISDEFNISVIGHLVIISSTSNVKLPLYSINGTIKAYWNVQQGVKTFYIEENGIYIIANTRILIK